MYLITKRTTYCDTKDEVIKIYNRYLKLMRDFEDDYDYVDRIKVLNDNGDVIYECKEFE